MSCYRCIAWGRGSRKYCPNCRQKDPVRIPDKTILFIRTPHTEEEMTRMDGSLERFKGMYRSIRILTSPKEKPREIARSLMTFFNVTEMTTIDGLAPPSGKLKRSTVTSIVPDKPEDALYILITHEPQCEIALEEYSRSLAGRSNPDRRHVARGRIVQVDVTRRAVYLL